MKHKDTSKLAHKAIIKVVIMIIMIACLFSTKAETAEQPTHVLFQMPEGVVIEMTNNFTFGLDTMNVNGMKTGLIFKWPLPKSNKEKLLPKNGPYPMLTGFAESFVPCPSGEVNITGPIAAYFGHGMSHSFKSPKMPATSIDTTQNVPILKIATYQRTKEDGRYVHKIVEIKGLLITR